MSTGAITALRRQLAVFVRARPGLHAAIHPPYHRLRRMLRGGRLRRYGAVTEPAPGNAAIRDALLSGRAHGIGKIGSLEAEALSCFLSGSAYPDLLLGQLVTNVGLYPGTARSVDAFCSAYLEALAQIDLLAVWGQPGEAEALRAAPAARTLLHIDALEPWLHAEPWSAALSGKRVVVLHPFARTIEAQYRRRGEIWREAGVLPDFDLRTVRMPLSPSLARPRFDDWEAQYADLIARIEAEPYDVVLVGAGGISLLVAAHARRQGRVGVHMGGLTQILFGILGRRWEKSAFVMAQCNASWTRPSGDEAPDTAAKVEQGCYW